MNLRQYVSEQVRMLSTPSAENAFCNLQRLTPTVIPELVEEFWNAKNPSVRAELVNVIWQFREKSTVEFLIEIMDDVHDQVWMNALDGLVTIGSTEVIQQLYNLAATLNPDDIRGAWIMEAIEQITEALQ